MIIRRIYRVLTKNILARNAVPISRKFLLSRPVWEAQNHRSLIDKWREKLEAEKVPEVDSALDNILAHVLQKKPVGELSKMTDLEMTPAQVNKFEKLCDCRLARMPVQYIVGEWDFRDLKLTMQPPVFIPRPETEELVELILQQQIDMSKAVRFLEVGCGTGAISLALLKSMPNAVADAVDQSSMACLLTMKNAISLKLSDRIKIIQSKLSDHPKVDQFKNKYDFIVSNPPYVPSRDMMHLDPEIRLYEDLRALDGGDDGMAVIKMLIQLATHILKPEGTLWLEVDPSHPELIARYLDSHSYWQLKLVATYPDLFGHERFVEIQRL